MVFFWDIESTSLEPWQPTARVTIIGIMSEDGTTTLFDNPDEPALLSGFWDWIRQHEDDFFMGFNSAQFDYPYLLKHSIVCNVKPHLPFKYKNFDLRTAIDKDRYASGSLLDICKLINGEHKEDNLSGTDVVQLFYDNNYELLNKYLIQDLKLTQILYNKLRSLGII